MHSKLFFHCTDSKVEIMEILRYPEFISNLINDFLVSISVDM
jgi:hypothetical protein